jgi:hypothetical protein
MKPVEKLGEPVPFGRRPAAGVPGGNPHFKALADFSGLLNLAVWQGIANGTGFRIRITQFIRHFPWDLVAEMFACLHASI